MSKPYSIRNQIWSAIIVSSDRVAEEPHSPSRVDVPSQSSTDRECKIGGRFVLPDALEHITLNSGEEMVSFRGEVSQGASDLYCELLFLSNPHKAIIPIPGFPLYKALILITGTSMLAVVFKRSDGKDVPVVTVGVALNSKSGEKLWQLIHEKALASMPLATRADSPPGRPWVAARLEPGMPNAIGAMQRLGDFERCIAWAFAHYVRRQNPIQN